MLLYQHTQGHYLAVPTALRFRPGCGYDACFDGQDVPDIICAAFVQEAGGVVLRESDTIELRAPVPALCQPRRPARSAARRRVESRPAGWLASLSRWVGGQQSAGAVGAH